MNTPALRRGHDRGWGGRAPGNTPHCIVKQLLHGCLPASRVTEFLVFKPVDSRVEQFNSVGCAQGDLSCSRCKPLQTLPLYTCACVRSPPLPQLPLLLRPAASCLRLPSFQCQNTFYLPHNTPHQHNMQKVHKNNARGCLRQWSV